MANEKYGIHTIGSITNATLFNRYKSAFRGCRLRQGWKLFETSPGVYVLTYWTDPMYIAINAGKYVSIMSAPSPASSNNTPQWLFNTPYSVPFVTTDRGTYPHFLNSTFISRFLSHWQNGIKPMLLSFSGGDEDYLLCWQSAEGSTGDPGTYKGDITAVSINGVAQPASDFPLYEINDNTTWEAHKRANLWPVQRDIIAANFPNIHQMINISNDFIDFDWLITNCPTAWFKIGYPGHTYNLPGEIWQQEGIKYFANSAPDFNRMQAEGENFEKLGWWGNGGTQTAKENIEALLESFAAHGGDIINISLADMNSYFGNDLSLMVWANQYIGYRKVSDTDRGFLVPRMVIDIAADLYSSVPVSTYPVIDPAQQATYNARVSSINSNSAYSSIQKKILIMHEKVNRLNPARITALRAAFPDAAYHYPDYDQDQDGYNTDFGVDMMQNYEKFVYQSFLDPSEEGIYRYGKRWGKKASNWYIWSDLFANGNYQVKVTIITHDVDNVTWALQYNNGSTTLNAAVISGGNTGNLITTVIAIPDLQGGKLMTHASDFVLSTFSAAKISIGRIDIVRVAENVAVDTPPEAEAGANQTITLPVNSVNLSGSATTDNSIVSWLWEVITGSGGMLTNPGSQVTGFTGLTEGTYIVQLTVTDENGLTDTDTVTITVQASVPVNQPPVANAGPNQTLTLPTTSTTLDGTGSTDDNAITAQLWTFVSGPVAPVIVSPSSLITVVNGMTVAGDYIFRLYVQDADGEIDHDGIRVRIKTGNNPPICIINTPDTAITLPVNSVSVDATVEAGANAIDTVAWTQQSGPGTATINTAPGSTLEVAYQGHPFTISSYAFTLKGTPVEGDYVQFDFSINLNPVDPPVDYSINSTVLAGWTLADLITDLYDKAFAINSNTLTYTDGDGNDGVRVRGFDTSDGFAEVTQVAGDGVDVTFEDLIQGVYVFRLTATDTDGNVTFDEITIIVNEEISASNPVAIIQNVGTINLPNAIQELNGSDSYDNDGSIVSYLWELAGDSPADAGYNIDTPDESITIIRFTLGGTFKFNLTVTDNDGNTNTASVTFKVNYPPEITIDPDEYNLTLPLNYIVINTTVVDIDGTVTLEWVQIQGTPATIDDPTSDDILITDLSEGVNVFRLYATDNDGAQTYEDVYIYVNVNRVGGFYNKLYRFYICNINGISYKYENGIVSLESYKALKYAPEGWDEIEIKLPRNTKYWGLDRNFTSQYKFVKDGAAIIRYLAYNKSQRGIESKAFLVALKWDQATGIYEPYFTSEIDLSEIIDEPKTGVTVNLIEGGAAKIIKTFETVVYEVPCNASNHDCKKISYDGVDLHEKLTYNTYEFDAEVHAYLLPLVYVTNEGDSVGIEAANQSPDQLTPSPPGGGDANDYLRDSANYPFRTATGILQLHITGSIKLTPTEKAFLNTSGVVRFRIYKSKEDHPFGDNIYIGQLNDDVVGQEYEFPIDLYIDIRPDEKIYIGFDVIAFDTGDVHNITVSKDSPIYFEFTTKAPPSQAYSLTWFELMAALVQLMSNGTCKFESSLLSGKPYLRVLSGDALRGFDTAVIKTTFEDCVKSAMTILGGALGIRRSDNTILFELKEFFFDNETEIIDLGEVSDLKFSVAKDLLFNTAHVGYPDQDYQQRNGRNEFNSEQFYLLPQTRIVKELDLMSIYRADPYGMEFIRYELFNKETTDNTGDNDTFIVNVDESATESAQYNGSRNSDQSVTTSALIEFETVSGDGFTANAEKTEFTSGINPQQMQVNINIELSGSDQTTFAYILKNNVAVFTKQIIISGGTGGSTFGIPATQVNPGDVISFRVTSVSGSFTITTASFTITYTSVATYSLRREVYDAITGIDSADTIFNIEELTPKRILLANYFFMGALEQVNGDLVQFQSGKKNVLLSTTLDGVTITENTNVRVSDFEDSPVRAFMLEFTTKVPVNILYLLQNAGKGYITLTWNGVRLYGFPYDLSVRPSYLDAQTWKLLLSSKTDPSELEAISNLPVIVNEMGIISHKNSFKFVPLGSGQSLQYHLKHMDEELHANRVGRYGPVKPYYQKYQTNDAPPIQIITKGTSLRIRIITCKNRLVDEITPTQVTNAAVVYPNILYETTIDWSQYPAGLYYINLIFGVGSTAQQWISEPIKTKSDYPNTLILEYGNTLNKQDMIFNGGYMGKLRFEGIIQKYMPDADFTSFEDDGQDEDTLYAVPFRKWELFIGGDFGMPDWLIDKIYRCMLLDNVKIEGHYYQVEKGSKPELIEIPGMPYSYWKLSIREQNNRQGVDVTGSGIDGGEITVEYNINTKAFTSIQTPTVDQGDNLVQVTDVE